VLAIDRGLRVGRTVLVAPPVEMTHFLHGFARLLGLSPARLEGLRRRIEERVGHPMDEFDLRNIVPALTAPALVLHDPDDTDVPFEHGRALATAWPGAKFGVVEGLGHRSLLKDPGVIADAVRFLSSPTPPAEALESELPAPKTAAQADGVASAPPERPVRRRPAAIASLTR
jgi:pimeloyl-ACP methyl ester carboxylesterase